MLILTGSAKRHECSGSDRQARPAQPEEPLVVHPGHMRQKRRRSVRGPRLAVQHTEEQQAVAAPPRSPRKRGNNDNKQQYIEDVCLRVRDNGERGLNGHKEASGLVLV